jgi:N-acetylmuramoyl-L-alanine amidase
VKVGSAFEPDAACVDAVRPAINANERAAGAAVDMIILHYTGMADAEAALTRLTAGDSGVSCHYFVWPDGRIEQLLPESVRAWHAGVSFWQGERDINSRSIGIEIANPGHDFGYPDFDDGQIGAVIRLCRDCGTRRHISAERILAHSDVAPRRKQDPGEKFPWRELHAGGVGHWVEPTPIGGGRYFHQGDAGEPVAALQSMLALYGYEIEIDSQFGVQTAAVVTAFQRHFRPLRVDGVADFSTIDTLHRLLSSLST